MARNNRLGLWLVVMSVFLICGTAAPGVESMAPPAGSVPDLHQLCSSGSADLHYTLNVRVRLLILWISRLGVGAGDIVLTEDDDGTRGIALLIGSDPAKAPMKINRWGYIVEHSTGSCTELVGVMTEAEEQSVKQARENISRSNATHSFKAIRSRVQNGMAQSSVSYMKLTEDYTYREVGTLLDRIPQEGGRIRRLSVPEGAEPGFLFAVRNLVRESVDIYRRSGTSGVAPHAMRRYTFSGTHFELRRQSTRTVQEMAIGSSRYQRLLESDFEARNLSNGELSRFTITYGVQDPIAEMPVRIVYRPRWWFEAEMLLDCNAAATQAARGGVPWKSGTR